MLSCINANRKSIPNFYIFKVCNNGGTTSTGAKRECAWLCNHVLGWQHSYLTSCLITLWLVCKKWEATCQWRTNISWSWMDMLAMSQLKLQWRQKNIGLDGITLPSHTSHALQPLDVSCFKSFKVAFRACSDSWTLTHRGVGAKEEDLASWIARGLKKTFTPKKIVFKRIQSYGDIAIG